MLSKPPYSRHRDRGHFEIHVCTGSCISPPISTAGLIATAAAIAFIVPIIVIVLLAAATHLFGK